MAKVIFTPRVDHPGTTAQPFLVPSVRQAQALLLRKLIPAAFKRAQTSGDIRKELGFAVKAAAFKGLILAQARCPVDQGRLKNSLTVEQRGEFRYTVGTNVRYAKWVEEGTRPHVILPRRKSVLRFVVKRPRIS